MKSMTTLALTLVMLLTAGCPDKDKGGSPAAGPGPAKTPNDQQRCQTAVMRDGQWYDSQNVIIKTNCNTLNNYSNNSYLLPYDNQMCNTRKYQNQPTYMTYVFGQPQCASVYYFYQFNTGQNVFMPQVGQTYYLGYPSGFYGGYWCSTCDGEWNEGDVLAAGVIGLGLGLILGSM